MHKPTATITILINTLIRAPDHVHADTTDTKTSLQSGREMPQHSEMFVAIYRDRGRTKYGELLEEGEATSESKRSEKLEIAQRAAESRVEKKHQKDRYHCGAEWNNTLIVHLPRTKSE